ncbi:alpha/beta hydrolase fold-domain-containing protein [Obelidium mucronatum]|nr:alpha/beta hydrolase fold-domain-containing protein [Obelidium mucronatum]
MKFESEPFLGFNTIRHRPTRVSILTVLITLACNVALFIIFVFSYPSTEQSEDTSPFHWTTCPGKQADANYKCGSLSVPLDYTQNTTAGKTIDIAIALYKAQVLPSLGTITFNFGGPGGPGKASVLAAGKALSELTGGRHDILGFDPRGIGESVPITCFKTANHHAQFDVMASGVNPPDTLGSTTLVSSYAAVQEAWAKSCAKWAGDILPHMGTTQVARDMDEIRKALGDDVLNYYGFSYGTMLGTVYVSMFPDRVGRAIIDGVMNPLTYMGGPIFKDTPGDVVDSDELFKVFAHECDKAGPTRCALSHPKHKTSHRIHNFLKDLESRPLVVEGSEVPSILDAPRTATAIYNALYRPSGWSKFARDLASAMAGNATELVNPFLGDVDSCPIMDSSADNGLPGVTCLDTIGNDVSLKEWEKASEKGEDVSRLFGRASVWQYLVCKYWQVKPVERFTGPWNNMLRNKLLIGNTLDVITPLRNAKTVERILKGSSVLLHHDGYGHCSTAHKSSCTLRYIRQLFVNGSYPESGTKCSVDHDVVLFPEADSLVQPKKTELEEIHDLIVQYNIVK